MPQARIARQDDEELWTNRLLISPISIFSRAQIAPRIGARQLGYNITVVPPGKRALPFHNRRVNEEMFFILEGTGELRYGEATYPVRPGDVIACPTGGTPRMFYFVGKQSDSREYWEGE